MLVATNKWRNCPLVNHLKKESERISVWKFVSSDSFHDKNKGVMTVCLGAVNQYNVIRRLSVFLNGI